MSIAFEFSIFNCDICVCVCVCVCVCRRADVIGQCRVCKCARQLLDTRWQCATNESNLA
jgi:hypothetical protein